LTLKDVTGVVNLINAESIHNRTSLPGITDDMYKEMHEITEWVFKRKFQTRDMGKLCSGHLVQEIRDRFTTSKNAHSQGLDVPHDFTFFSGHDGTLLALMSALELRDLHVPNYASHMVFELHFENGEYSVRLLYDDGPVIFPGCTEKCPLNRFFQIIQLAILDDWQGQCFGKEDHLVSPIDITNLISLAIGILVGILGRNFWKSRHSHFSVAKMH